MTAAVTPPHDLLKRFHLTRPRFVVQTEIAQIWQVRRANGQVAALKYCPHGHMGNERFGFDYLTAANGTCAAHVYATSQNAAVMEWLPGPSLGDLSRTGKDAEAAKTLVAVANGLHSAVAPDTSDWPHLDQWCQPIFTLHCVADCSPDARRCIAQAQNVARQCLRERGPMGPLHGDLHHDNIRKTDRGYVAFDAKGVVGDRTYDLANAFRHPKNLPEVVLNPDRVRHLRDVWSTSFHVPPKHLMGWAVAKAALSLAWRSGGAAVSDDPELPLLAVLLEVHENTPNL